MKRKACIISILLSCKSLQAYESVTFTGTNFSSEEEFSRVLKAQYDIIKKKWNFPSENTITLEAYYLEKKELVFVNHFAHESPNEKDILNENHAKYVNYGLPIIFAIYGAIFWDWGKVHRFRFKDEGWFQRHSYAGGADKVSHAFCSFLADRMIYSLYRDYGLSREEALRQSFLMSSIMGLLVEMGDSFSRYGFSYEDLLSDMVGTTFGHLLNTHAYLDELIGLQFWWMSNATTDQKKKESFYDKISDYNRQKYILNLRFAAIPYLRKFKLTRYINIDLGYYTRGYNHQVPPPEGPTRTLYTGVSLNLTQLLRDLFPRSDYSYYTGRFLKYYQAPYTAAD